MRTVQERRSSRINLTWAERQRLARVGDVEGLVQNILYFLENPQEAAAVATLGQAHLVSYGPDDAARRLESILWSIASGAVLSDA